MGPKAKKYLLQYILGMGVNKNLRFAKKMGATSRFLMFAVPFSALVIATVSIFCRLLRTYCLEAKCIWT